MSLPASAIALSPHRRNDRPEGKVGIIAAELGAVEARYGTIEEQRILAVEAIAEQPREAVKIDPAVRYRKDRGVLIDSTDPVAPLERGTAGRERRMDCAVNHQHRSRLGGELGGRPRPYISFGLEYPRTATGGEEHAVGLHMEVARAVPAI